MSVSKIGKNCANRSALGEAQQRKERGRPFQPGNPGRPPGSKNQTTRLVEQLVAGDAEMLGRKMIELAKEGNVRCLEYCLDRLFPKRTGRPLDFHLPEINSVHDLVAAMANITTAVNNGDLTAEEAAHLVHCYEGYGRMFAMHDVEVRLKALELQMKENKNAATVADEARKAGTNQ